MDFQEHQLQMAYDYILAGVPLLLFIVVRS